MNKDLIPNGRDFEDVRFAENNKQLFDEYINLIVRGYDHQTAMALVFGPEMLNDMEARLRLWGIQRNPYYKRNFPIALEKAATAEIWNPKLAVHNLAKIALNPEAKETARINAMKELNVITGITIVDENGQTKIGRSMDDFYSTLDSALSEFALQKSSGNDTQH